MRNLTLDDVQNLHSVLATIIWYYADDTTEREDFDRAVEDLNQYGLTYDAK
jgi:hypothetical protein